MAQKLINCNAYGNPDGALLHMLRTPEQRKAEIKDLEKYIQHIKNTNKQIDKKYQFELDMLKDSLEYLTGNFVEIKIWSRNKINAEDTIKYGGNEFTVAAIVSCSNHDGRFKNPQDKIKTFYTVVATKTRLI